MIFKDEPNIDSSLGPWTGSERWEDSEIALSRRKSWQGRRPGYIPLLSWQTFISAFGCDLGNDTVPRSNRNGLDNGYDFTVTCLQHDKIRVSLRICVVVWVFKNDARKTGTIQVSNGNEPHRKFQWHQFLLREEEPGGSLMEHLRAGELF